eukprot:1071945-Amphidinium_carterae.3
MVTIGAVPHVAYVNIVTSQGFLPIVFSDGWWASACWAFIPQQVRWAMKRPHCSYLGEKLSTNEWLAAWKQRDTSWV